MADEVGDIGRHLRRQAGDAGRQLGRQARQVARELRDEAITAALEPLTPARRRAMTREHLLEAAAIVFARDGFHGASLDTIAATAGFTKGAVYSNFKSKEDLFLALVDDRIERQFAVISEVLESGPHDRAEQLPRIRDVMKAVGFWDEEWSALSLEFVLYARRNPEAREKLASTNRRNREFVENLIEQEYAAIGATPPYSVRALAEVSLALYLGFDIRRMIDPSSVTDDTLTTILDLMYDWMGVPDDQLDGS